jgi:histidinol-phosphatase (PHP family)
VVEPPDLDVESCLECVQRCRDRFPDLHILSGVELSELHWHRERAEALLRTNDFDRVLGSVHSVRGNDGCLIVDLLYRSRPAEQVVREYLTETLHLVESSTPFAVLAHIDYPVRAWPHSAGPYRPSTFEEEFRAVLRALARSGRALEVNTEVPLQPEVVRWRHEVGGDALCFGSDAHAPSGIGNGFAEAAAMVAAQGFRPGRHPHDFWVRGT